MGLVPDEGAVADHESGSVRLRVKVHDQVAGLLGGPFPGRMQSDPQDADALAGVLDHGQDVSMGAVEQVGREEVARQDRAGLGTQELRPRVAKSAAVRGRSRRFSGSPMPSTPLPSLLGRPARRGFCGSPIRDSPGPAAGPVP